MTKTETKTLPNILVSISAEPKSGKTYLAFTFPEPIKVYSFDLRAKPVVKKFPDKKIDIHEFDIPIIESENPAPWATPIWDVFYKEFKADVESGEYETLVIDPATTVEMILRQTILEMKQEEKPDKQKLATNEYGLRNLRMLALFEQARRGGVNLVTIQYIRERWSKNQRTGQNEPTGEMILDGWDKTDGQVDVVLEMEAKQKAGKCVMVTTIKANGFDRDLNGKVFEDVTYNDLIALLVGDE